jgi:signal transduction histidine kinase
MTSDEGTWTMRLLRGISGPLVTVLMIAMIEGLDWLLFRVRFLQIGGTMPYSYPLLLVAIAAHGTGGVLQDVLSMAIALVYAAYYMSPAGSPFTYTPEEFQRFLVLAISTGMFVATSVRSKSRLRAGQAIARDQPVLVRKLAEKSGLLQAILDVAPDGVLAVARDGTILAMNSPFSRMWALPDLAHETVENVFERMGAQLQAQQGEVREGQLWRQEASTGTRSTRELVLQDGRTFEIVTAPVDVPDSARAGQVWYHRDVTAWKHMVRELAGRLEQIRELDRLKVQFLGHVSHEFRTPLASIKGYAEFLEDQMGGALSQEQLGFVAGITKASRELERLVEALLDFARLEAGEFSIEPQVFDLAARVRDRVLAFQEKARAHGVDLRIDASPDPLPVTLDPRRIEQVVDNLLDNAIRFNRPGGLVQLVLEAEERSCRLVVRDTGRGIPAEHQSRLFEKFHQVDASSTRERGGAGLGLALIRALVEAHGGRIAVESRLGAGSTFTVTLPRHVTGPAGPGASIPPAGS